MPPFKLMSLLSPSCVSTLVFSTQLQRLLSLGRQGRHRGKVKKQNQNKTKGLSDGKGSVKPLSVPGNHSASWGVTGSPDLQIDVKTQRSDSLKGTQLSTIETVPLAANPVVAPVPSTELRNTLVVNASTSRDPARTHPHTSPLYLQLHRSRHTEGNG